MKKILLFDADGTLFDFHAAGIMIKANNTAAESYCRSVFLCKGSEEWQKKMTNPRQYFLDNFS